MLGALTSALLLLVVGSLLRPIVPVAVATTLLAGALVVAMARDAGLLRIRLPENRRLVPEEVTSHGPVLGAVRFGFEMGTGVRTFVPTSLPYVAAAAVFLLGGPSDAAVAGVGFALGRWVMAIANRWYGREGYWDTLWDQAARSVSVLLAVGFTLLLAVVIVLAWSP